MDSSNNSPPPYDEFDVRLAATTQRLIGLEQSFQQFASNIAAQLSSLSTKLDERSRTPWATIFAAMGVVLGIVIAGGQLAKAPIDQSLSRLEHDTEMSVPMDQYRDFKATYESNRIVGRNDSDNRFAALEQKIGALAQNVVPRGENEEHWRDIDNHAADLQRQLDEMKKVFGDTYSLHDALQAMQARLDKLETMRSTK